jgi:hypothetical protein
MSMRRRLERQAEERAAQPKARRAPTAAEQQRSEQRKEDNLRKRHECHDPAWQHWKAICDEDGIDLDMGTAADGSTLLGSILVPLVQPSAEVTERIVR